MVRDVDKREPGRGFGLNELLYVDDQVRDVIKF